jgi:glycosyltransferase involved in cell wall biosynthesis
LWQVVLQKKLKIGFKVIMRKIGILAFSGQSAGGIYQYTQSIIDALKNDNSNRYIIFCNIYDNRFENSGLEVRKINKPKSNFVVKTIRLLQYLFLIREPYFFNDKELNIFNDIDIFLSPTISIYPHFYLNKPFVFTLHDMQERYYPEFFTTKERIIRWLRNKILAKSANRIICESDYVKNDITKFIKINSNKISIIQSPPPEEFLNYKFKEENFQKVRKKYDLPEKYIFYPAQCWYHKNHIRLVEAFKIVNEKCNDIHLIMTGSQKNNYNNLIEKIKELNLEEKSLHLGYIDYEDVPYLYKMSMMLIMPSLFESVSIPIYEAFALEVPVCSSNVVALPEQVGDAGLIFDPNSINDIANKILIYIEDEDLRKEKAYKGYIKVKNFNHREYQKKLLRILNAN